MGEREAARRAAERIRARLSELKGREPETEYRYTLHDPWKRKLFLALCRRYGLKPYRERGQRYTSVMLRAPKSFQDKTPEYQALSAELDAHLDELTTRVIREAIDDDVSEASDEAPKSLDNGGHESGCERRRSRAEQRERFTDEELGVSEACDRARGCGVVSVGGRAR